MFFCSYIVIHIQGINQIILVINKMDVTTPSWSQVRFTQIETQVKELLRNLQVNTHNVIAIPVSGLAGGNLIERPKPAVESTTDTASVNPWDWYSGPTLIEAIDGLLVPEHAVRGSLRAIVTASPSQAEILQRKCDIHVTVLRGRLKVGRSVGIPYQHQGTGERQCLTSGAAIQETPLPTSSAALANPLHNNTAPANVLKICNTSGANVPYLAAGESGIISIESRYSIFYLFDLFC